MTYRIEYRDGYEEVSVLKGGVGFGIARFPSVGGQVGSLHKELHHLRKKRVKLAVSGAQYEIRTRAYERFAEQAFEVRLRRI